MIIYAEGTVDNGGTKEDKRHCCRCDQSGRENPSVRATGGMGNGGPLESGSVGRPCALGCH